MSFSHLFLRFLFSFEFSFTPITSQETKHQVFLPILFQATVRIARVSQSPDYIPPLSFECSYSFYRRNPFQRHVDLCSCGSLGIMWIQSPAMNSIYRVFQVCQSFFSNEQEPCRWTSLFREPPLANRLGSCGRAWPWTHQQELELIMPQATSAVKVAQVRRSQIFCGSYYERLLLRI